MASAQRGNGFDKKLTTIFVTDIEKHMKELDVIAAERMAESKEVRDTIAEIYDRAKDAGIPKKELKAVVRTRALEARAKAARESLDSDQIETYDQIRLALGDLADTPLGQAAGGAPQTDAEGDQAKSNVTALTKGIKPKGMPGADASHG